VNVRVLAAALVLAWPLQSLDDAARDALQRSRSPVLEPVARFASDRSRVVLVGAAAVSIVAGGAARAAAVEAAVALVPVNLVVELLKRATFRVRPDGERKRNNAAFPSSHAANAFAVATVVGRRWRRAGPLAFACASVVGWSRLYLDRHWASDVAAGALLGVSLALLALHAWESWRSSGSSRNTSTTV
jgi:membrane-associated phospholipid phosphatase